MKSEHQLVVEQFMNLAGQTLPQAPTLPSEHTRLIRARLILEESLEAISALGINIYSTSNCGDYQINEHSLKRGEISLSASCMVQPNLADITKELADVIVVTTGTASACGIDMQPIQEAVDNNNLQKFGKGSFRDENGKWNKPPNFKKPDIQSLLDKQTKENS